MLLEILFWLRRWKVSYMYQIPTIQAVHIHILSADIGDPQGSVAKQVTERFKSLPDASFSQTEMKNRAGPSPPGEADVGAAEK